MFYNLEPLKPAERVADAWAMIDGISAASTGIQSATTAVSVAANNIANIDTPAYSAAAAEQTSGSSGGAVKLPNTANPTDLSFQIPAMQMAQDQMSASVAVMKTAQQMYTSVLQLLPNAKVNAN